MVRRFEHLRHLERWRAQGVGIAFEKVEPEVREAIARFVSTQLEPEEPPKGGQARQFTPAGDSSTS